MVYRAELAAPSDPAADPGAGGHPPPAGELNNFERAQSGCPEAFARMVEEFGPRILRYLRHWTGNEHDAEDLTQETFLKAYRGLRQCSHAGAVGGWLFTIARRTALNFHRARRSRPSKCLELYSEIAEEGRSNGSEISDWLWEAARALPSEHFEVLWLRYAEDLSVAEIGRALRWSQINVRVRLHRARGLLRRRLEADGRGHLLK